MEQLKALLLSSDAFSAIISTVLFLLVNVIKKFIPEKFKKVIPLLPFALGIILSAAAGYVFKREVNLESVLTGGVKSGGEAAFLYALYRQLIKKTGDKKQAVEKILSVLLNKNNLKKASEEIVSLIKSEPDKSRLAEKIGGVIASNASVSEDVLSATIKLLFKAVEKTE